MISFAIWARMAVQAHAAIRLESSSNDDHPDDEVNRSQHIQEVGNLKHDSCLLVSYLSAPHDTEVCDLDHTSRVVTGFFPTAGRHVEV
jgi:hypothetical protein